MAYLLHPPLPAYREEGSRARVEPYVGFGGRGAVTHGSEPGGDRRESVRGLPGGRRLGPRGAVSALPGAALPAFRTHAGEPSGGGGRGHRNLPPPASSSPALPNRHGGTALDLHDWPQPGPQSVASRAAAAPA